MTGPSVLFLCTGNYYRSRTAEALFNMYTARQGLAARAVSRGLRLDAQNKGPISKHAVAWLIARQIPYDDRYPIDVTEADLVAARRVIAVDETEHRPLMAQRFAEWEERVEYWNVHDIDRTVPDDALSSLDTQVRALLDIRDEG